MLFRSRSRPSLESCHRCPGGLCTARPQTTDHSGRSVPKPLISKKLSADHLSRHPPAMLQQRAAAMIEDRGCSPYPSPDRAIHSIRPAAETTPLRGNLSPIFENLIFRSLRAALSCSVRASQNKPAKANPMQAQFEPTLLRYPLARQEAAWRSLTFLISTN